VVAVIGDGALTGGMAWEALNNIRGGQGQQAGHCRERQRRSYQPTIGGLAHHLATVRINQRYENVLDYIKTTLTRTPVVGPPLYGTLHGMKKGLKDVLQPAGPVRGPRPEVPGAHRRPRRAGHGDGDAPGPRLRRPR